ncbi:MAG TPA: hypothetical protein VK737_09225 [Opitutales bacterium]|jgi:uncharacterized protein involved in exopolysaccharide biosynthesis|nr:hypothetical protein [Opitutales bacterium]
MKFFYVIRQRRSALAAVFLLCAVAYFAYSFITGHEFTAFALVQGYAPGVAATGTQAAVRNDFDTNVRILQSMELSQNVAAKLDPAMRGRLLAPYGSALHLGPSPSVEEILLEGRTIGKAASDLNLDIGFQHPDPVAAAFVANALAEEFVRQHDALNDGNIKKAIAPLQDHADELKKQIADIQASMDEITKNYGVTNMAASSGIEIEDALKELNKNVITNKAALDKLAARDQQIRDQVAAQNPLWQLDFIGSDEHIISLIQTVRALNDQSTAIVAQGYDPTAPIVTEAKAAVDTAIQKLNVESQAMAQRIDSDFQVAQSTYDLSVSHLADMQKHANDVSQQRVKYDSLHSDLETAQKKYGDQTVAIDEAQRQAKLSTVSYSIVARADAPPVPDAKPWLKMSLTSLGWGLGGGLLAAMAFTIFLPPPAAQHQEYERRRRRHRHFSSSSSRRKGR